MGSRARTEKHEARRRKHRAIAGTAGSLIVAAFLTPWTRDLLFATPDLLSKAAGSLNSIRTDASQESEVLGKDKTLYGDIALNLRLNVGHRPLRNEQVWTEWVLRLPTQPTLYGPITPPDTLAVRIGETTIFRCEGSRWTEIGNHIEISDDKRVILAPAVSITRWPNHPKSTEELVVGSAFRVEHTDGWKLHDLGKTPELGAGSGIDCGL